MKLLRNQKGQTALEYGLIVAVLAIVVIAAVRGPLNTALSTAFNKVQTNVTALS